MNQRQKQIYDFVLQNQPCRASLIIQTLNCKKSYLYKLLSSDMFLKSERLYDKPANPKGGGPYYLYSVNPHYVADSKQTRSSLPKQHPLMSAFYGI